MASNLIKSMTYECLPESTSETASPQDLSRTRAAEICFCIVLDPTNPDVIGNCLESFTVLACAQQAADTIVPESGDPYVFKNTMLLSLVALGFEVSQNPAKKNEWKICVTYGVTEFGDGDDNNDVDPSDPETYPCEIQTEYVEREEVKNNWRLKRYCKADGTTLEPTLGEPNPSAGIPPRTVPVGYMGRMLNSNGCPVRQTSTRYLERISVTSYVRNWDCGISGNLGKVNSANVIMFQTDKDGIRFLCSYAAGTLKIIGLSKRDLTINGCLFFCIDLKVEYNPDGHSEKLLAQGSNAAFAPGLPGPDGKIIRPGERVDRCASGKRSVLYCEGNPATGAVALTDYGTELQPGEDQVYMDYECDDNAVDFGVFSICGIG